MTLWRTVGCSAVFYKNFQDWLGKKKDKKTKVKKDHKDFCGQRLRTDNIGKRLHNRHLHTESGIYISWIKPSFWYPNFYPFDVLFVKLTLLCDILNRTTQAAKPRLCSLLIIIFYFILFFIGSHDQATNLKRFFLSRYISSLDFVHPWTNFPHFFFLSQLPLGQLPKKKNYKPSPPPPPPPSFLFGNPQKVDVLKFQKNGKRKTEERRLVDER